MSSIALMLIMLTFCQLGGPHPQSHTYSSFPISRDPFHLLREKARSLCAALPHSPPFLKIFLGVQLFYNVILVSDVQLNESVICIHIATHFQILFPYRPLQSIEQSSLSYTVRPYLLPILQCVYVNPVSQSNPLLLAPYLVTQSLFSTSVTLFLFHK